jgi:shikimate kinase
LPTLTVIAGPNGAGKSMGSSDILSSQGIQSFDYDIEFHSEWKKFSFDPIVERGIREFTENLFQERKEEAIKNKTNFAFETNYHTSEVMKTVDDFTKRRL